MRNIDKIHKICIFLWNNHIFKKYRPYPVTIRFALTFGQVLNKKWNSIKIGVCVCVLLCVRCTTAHRSHFICIYIQYTLHLDWDTSRPRGCLRVSNGAADAPMRVWQIVCLREVRCSVCETLLRQGIHMQAKKKMCVRVCGIYEWWFTNVGNVYDVSCQPSWLTRLAYRLTF